MSRTAWTVARLELLGALRDGQTVLYTVVLPLALYPVLFWVLLQARTYFLGRDEATSVRVALVAQEAGTLAADLRADLEQAADTARVEAWIEPPDAVRDSAELLAREDGPDAVVVLSSEATTIVYDGTRSRSRLARERVEARLDALVASLRATAVRGAGADPDALRPFALVTQDVASTRDLSAYVFSLVLPLLFVVMAVLGAFHPAVDVTAGEKERGTVETTLLAPAPRLGVQLGKIGAVATCALVAVVLNLLGLVLAAEPLLVALGDTVAVEVPWARLALVLPLCGAFLFTVSALMVALASFTDTFKQGQSLLGAVQLVFLLPALVAVLPDVELTPALAALPIVQTVLAFRSVLTGAEGQALAYGVVVLSQALYAGLSIWLCVRLASREALSSSGTSLRRALQLWRSEGTPR